VRIAAVLRWEIVVFIRIMISDNGSGIARNVRRIYRKNIMRVH